VHIIIRAGGKYKRDKSWKK